MRILFCENRLSERGTSVALYDYAHYNELLLRNESFICYSTAYGPPHPEVYTKFKARFGEIYFYSSVDELNQLCDRLDIDACYFIKAGFDDGILSNRPNFVHAVFRYFEPHGTVYAYVSKWLADGRYPYVPHIVNLPPPTGKLFESDKIVVGRYGGFHEFNIPFVMDTIHKFPDYNFLFANTKWFTNAPNCIFMDAIIDLQEKSNFLASCDAFLHARASGESFGLAICEALHQGIPVLAWNGGGDRHHIELLRDTGLLYNNPDDLAQLLDGLRQGDLFRRTECAQIVGQFSPERVMRQFKEVFLDKV
ncbi:MAG: glycosyltransferase [Anaerolineaceae bacterium]|nr:glycosyltransferase [Anaerolineaceae bacterium]